MWAVPAAIVSLSWVRRPAEDTRENTEPLPGPGLTAVSLTGMLTSPFPAPPEASARPTRAFGSNGQGRGGSRAGDACSGHGRRCWTPAPAKARATHSRSPFLLQKVVFPDGPFG